MYYLSKTQAPVPADAPYAAHLNEKKEWEYHQMRHKQMLANMTTQVNTTKPKSINPKAQSIQAYSRRFHVDAKNAEIGRENRKLVDKLMTIAKTSGQCAPPGSISGYGAGPQPLSMGGGCTTRAPGAGYQPSKMPGGPGGSSSRCRSLNDNFRRAEQQRMDRENAGMVRRILSVNGTFDPARDERSFQRHKRAVNLLQRLPATGGKTNSLPPLNPNRPKSYPAPAKGLDCFMLPSDLHRSPSAPNAVNRSAALMDVGAATAPAGSLPAASEGGGGGGGQLGSQTYSQSGFDTYNSFSTGEGETSQSRNRDASNVDAAQADRKDSSREASGGLSQNTLPRPAVGPGPEEEAGSAARAAPSAFGKRDDETDKRQWTQGPDGDKGPAVGIGIAAPGGTDNLQGTSGAGRSLGLAGMSGVSDLQYADDWDEFSMNSSGNADASRSAAPSRGPSAATDLNASVRTPPAAEQSAPPPASSVPAAALSSTPEAAEAVPAAAASNSLEPAPANTKPAAEDFSMPPDFGSKKKRAR